MALSMGANWRLANAKSFIVHENNPESACMHEIERMEREGSVQATSHQLSCFVSACRFL